MRTIRRNSKEWNYVHEHTKWATYDSPCNGAGVQQVEPVKAFRTLETGDKGRRLQHDGTHYVITHVELPGHYRLGVSGAFEAGKSKAATTEGPNTQA